MGRNPRHQKYVKHHVTREEVSVTLTDAALRFAILSTLFLLNSFGVTTMYIYI